MEVYPFCMDMKVDHRTQFQWRNDGREKREEFAENNVRGLRIIFRIAKSDMMDQTPSPWTIYVKQWEILTKLSERPQTKIRSCPQFARLSIEASSTNNGEIIHKQNTKTLRICIHYGFICEIISRTTNFVLSIVALPQISRTKQFELQKTTI